MNDITFQDLNLNNALHNALDDLGLSTPTAIQAQSMSVIMSGKDLLGISPTGSGKTLAYLLPIIRLWTFSRKKTPDTIIVVPTRELVVQVCEMFEQLAKYTSVKIAGAYGGTNIRTQMDHINAGVDVVVATPGRMLDLIVSRTIPAGNIKRVVIDEVDEMLKLGFRADIKNLVDLLPEKHQTLMFSATLNGDIDMLTENTSRTPVRIEIEKSGTPASGVMHKAYEVPNINTGINLLAHLLSFDSSMTRVLVFAGGKRMADYVNAELGFKLPDEVSVIHGNKNQNRRLSTLEDFESGACRVLVASDLVARGIDVNDVSHVINLNVPESIESYIHRIGRTARAEKKGVAITLYTPETEASLGQLEHQIKLKFERIPFPDDIEISNQLLPEEEEKPGMKIIQPKKKKDPEKGASFHEKKDKNKKVPIKIRRGDRLKEKYGKSKTKHGKKNS